MFKQFSVFFFFFLKLLPYIRIYIHMYHVYDYQTVNFKAALCSIGTGNQKFNFILSLYENCIFISVYKVQSVNYVSFHSKANIFLHSIFKGSSLPERKESVIYVKLYAMVRNLLDVRPKLKHLQQNENMRKYLLGVFHPIDFQQKL